MPGAGGIDVYTTADGKKVHALTVDTHRPTAAAFTPDGRSLVVRTTTDRIQLWDLAGSKLVREVQASVKSGGEPVVAPDGKSVVIPAGRPEKLQVYPLPGLRSLPGIPHPYHSAPTVVFSPSGKRLVAAGSRDPVTGMADTRRGVLVWDVARAEMLHDWSSVGLQCGFTDDDHLSIAAPDAITRYPIGRAPAP